MSPTTEPTEESCESRDSPEPSGRVPGSEEPEDKFIKECRQKGRWINVAICFGLDIQDIFKAGIRSEIRGRAGGSNNNLDDGDDSDTENYETLTNSEESDSLLKAYNDILRFIPKLKKILPYQPNANKNYYDEVISEIQHGCSSARSEMTRRIKDNMIRYLGAGQNPVQVEHHVSVYKAFRGLHDPNIGRLLIPAEDLDQWDEDPNGTRANFASGVFIITGCQMPVFLYENYAYNPEDPEEGLFRGAFFVCVLIDILFGANSVDTLNVKCDDHPHGHCIGMTYKLKTISPQNIAYAAVLARFTLSSQRAWSETDVLFNYRTFYKSILMRLDDPTDPWVIETIEWLNVRVFGNERGKLGPDIATQLKDAEWHLFLRRRTERKAEKRAEEAARIEALRGGSNPDAPQSTPPPSQPIIDPSLLDANPAVESFTQLTPRTPSAPEPIIDPALLETPELRQDTSIMEPSPSLPRTPDVAGPSLQNEHDSPLSNISDEDITNQTTQIRRPKRKRLTSTSEQSKTKPKRKSTRT